MSKLWGGRFEKETAEEVEIFTASIGVDSRLWDVDIRASLAHVEMLGLQKIIPNSEAQQIAKALKEIHQELETKSARGELNFDPKAEDIHSEIEKMLKDKIGPLSGKLHTARSRNDQVVTDTRLYLRESCLELIQDIRNLQTWIVEVSEKHLHTILPGLTHMQHGQPVSLAHHLMAYFWMLERDQARLKDALQRINILPLGSAALAGTLFPLDRAFVAEKLDFSDITENSLDAVSDRDFVIEFLSAASLVMMHLSRWSEELILWSTPEFNFVKLDDSVTTGSSIMPQKKNPDVAELIRGKVGRVYGALMGALTMLKALPLSYNRDLQEDKTFLFEGLDTVQASIRLMHLMLKTAKFQTESMAEKLRADFSNATDLADELVTLGLPFREAHEVVGRIVRHCLEIKLGIEDLSLIELQKFSSLFNASIIEKVKPLHVMEARKSEGGTSSVAVRAQIQKARKALES